MMRQIYTLPLRMKIIKTRNDGEVKKRENKPYLSKKRRQVKKTEFNI